MKKLLLKQNISILISLFLVGCSYHLLIVSNSHKNENFVSGFSPSGFKKETTSNDPLTMIFLGDIMLTRKAENLTEKKGNNFPFKKIFMDLKKYDLVFANLETSITTSTNIFKKKKYRFKLNPKNADGLLSLGLDIVSIANNHLLDFGLKGMMDTIKWLKKNSISFVGAGKSKSDAQRGVIKIIKNRKVVFLAYCERPPIKYFATKKRGGTARLYEPNVIYNIKKYKKRNNIVIVSLHWGREHTDIPRSYQIKRAHRLINAGADAIIGHHPHRPQSIEIYKGKPIIYSLGNFISGFENKLYKNNIAVTLKYKKLKLYQVGIISISGTDKNQFQPFFIKNLEKAKTEIERINSISAKFKTKFIINGYKGILKIK